MRVRLLGPIDVLADGNPRLLNGVRRKALLAALALAAGRVVASRRLIELTWPDSPPPAAANALQRHISHLRKVLGVRTAVAARSPGYLLDLGPEPTDVRLAERLLADADAAADPAIRLEHLRTATGLWSGPPLAEIRDLPFFDEQARRLDDLLLRVQLALLDAQVALGRGAQVITELEELARAHPWHEEIGGLLMRALYGTGRQADALAAYQRLKHSLNEDLGIDPGPDLRALETAILRQDPALNPPAWNPPAQIAPGQIGPAQIPAAEIPAAGIPAAGIPAAPPESGPGRAPVPAQLPLAVAGFTGREAELATLDELGGEPGIVAIAGTAGVGKTALAIQWAHRIAHRFTDGQLYINLRGYDPEQPVPAADALAGFLRALGVPGQDIPIGLDERAARYRTALAGRRTLIVLDNAGNAEQVRPLLPGASGCLVVVTSRDALAGLVALDGARRVGLDLLPIADAIALLRRLIGERVDEQPAAAARLATLCTRLPLALRVAAELAVAEPGSSLDVLVKALGDQQHRLEMLDAAGEVRAAVGSVFSWSYQRLPAETAGAFRAIGLHPGPDFDAYAVAALIGRPAEHAARLCAQLARAHLIQPHGRNRYAIHDLLRVYAIGLARSSAGDPEEALNRLLDHYLAAAAAAMNTLHPAERNRRPMVGPLTTTPPLSDIAPARAWLDDERANLVAACAYAAAHDRPTHAIRLAQTLFRYLDMGGHHAEALVVHQHAHRAARASGDRGAEARALNNMAAVYWWRAQYPEAAANYQEAAELFRAAGNPDGEADAWSNLGMVSHGLGDLAAAADHYRRALAAYRANGDTRGEGAALTGLGVVHSMMGDLDSAAADLRRALVLRRAVGKIDGEADTLTGLAGVYLRQGELKLAAENLEMALALYRQLGYPGKEADTLNSLGVVARAAGDPARAIDYHEQSLRLHRHNGTRQGEAAALAGLGGSLLAAGDIPAARRHQSDALRVATEVGDRYHQALAHDGLATIHRAAGDEETARVHWEQALFIYTSIGAAEADAVRASLSG